jgi:hypothetical protein
LKFGENLEEILRKTNMILKDFEGNTMEVKGFVNVELPIGSKMILKTFFITNGEGCYNLLLWRDWIRANCCISYRMHQILLLWIEDQVEIMSSNTAVNVAMTDLDSLQIEGANCIFGWVRDGKVIDQGGEFHAVGLTCTLGNMENEGKLGPMSWKKLIWVMAKSQHADIYQ